MVRPYQGTGEATSLEPVDLDPVRENRAWFLWLGAALVVLGALAIFVPFVASLATAIFFGWLLLFSGLFQGFHALQNQRWGGFGWAIVAGVIQVVAGALVLAFPLTGTLTLTLVLSAYFVAQGVLKIIRAVQHRAIPSWGWLLFDGLLSLVLGILIWVGWPSTAAWALGLIVGIDLVFGGMSVLLIGLAARRLASARP